MAFLTIGPTTVEISTQGARLQDVEQIGVGRRSFSGMLLSSVKAEKRVWDVETTPLDDTDAGSLYTAIGLYAVVSVTGDMVQGVATNCRIRSTGETFIPDGLLSLRKISLELSEV